MPRKRVYTSKGLAKELKLLGSQYTSKEMTTILKTLSMKGFLSLVRHSARDTGYLRSNWDVTTDPPPNLILSNPGGSFQSASWSDPGIKFGDVVVLYNNTEYARHLETGTPYTRAQPMVTPTYMMLTTQAKFLSKTLSIKKVG